LPQAARQSAIGDSVFFCQRNWLRAERPNLLRCHREKDNPTIVTTAAFLAVAVLSSPAFCDDSVKEQLKQALFAKYDQKELIVVNDKLRVTTLGRTNGADKFDFLITYRYLDGPKKD
jgi:hypothetical protein